MAQREDFNEKEAFRPILTEFRQIGKAFNVVGAARMGQPDSLTDLETALSKIPDADELAKLLEDLKAKSARTIKKARQERILNFDSAFAGFERQWSTDGKRIRQTSKGYRFGPLEIVARKEEAKVQFQYNHEPLDKWVSVRSPDDLVAGHAKALGRLEKAALDPALLVELLSRSYRSALRNKQKEKSVKDRVPVWDLYREFRLQLCRNELQKGRVDKKLVHADFPKWTFLYNLDRYWANASEISPSALLVHETGSQREVAKGMGMTINGLAASREYETICYVRRSGS